MKVLRGWIACLAVAGVAGPISAAEDDAEFVKHAASDGQLEVELGRHAATHAASPEVKRFGRMMVEDHTRANQQLEKIATREGIPVQKRMTEEQRELATKLTAMKGAEFDKAYMKEMVEDHEDAVEQFGEQAEQGKSEVDRWAANTLPVLRKHLEQARELQKKTDAEQVSRNP